MKHATPLVIVGVTILVALLPSVPTHAQARVDSLGEFVATGASGDGTSAIGLDASDTRIANVVRWREGSALAVVRPAIPNGQVHGSGLSADGSYAVGTEDDDWGDSSLECDPRQDGNGWTAEGRIFSWLWTPSNGTRRLDPNDDFCYLLRDVANTGVAVGFRRDTVGDVGDVSGMRAIAWDGSSFVDLYPGVSEPSDAVAISADGSTIVGWASPFGAVRFDPSGPVQLAPTTFNPTDISDDGSVVVGRSENYRDVIRWNAGVTDTLRSSSGFLNGTVLVSGDGKTVVAQWWGPFGPHNGPHTRVFLEDGTNESLWQLAQDRGVDVGPWLFSQPKGISTDGSTIFGWDAFRRGFRVVLGESINVIYPAANDILLPGSDVDITWVATDADTVDILIAYDYDDVSGTFEPVEQQYVYSGSPKAPGRQQAFYTWTVPDTLAPRAAFRIVKSSKPEIEDTSDRFSIKGYKLTRINAKGDFEVFDVDKNGWNFTNTDNFLAPPDAYNNKTPFQYVNDPITGARYPTFFTGSPTFAEEEDYPDWQSWVRAFTVRWSYVLEPGGAPDYRRSMVDFWSRQSRAFGGGCFGMSVTALMAFDLPLAFSAKFPLFGGETQLDQLATAFLVSDPVRNAIAEMFAYQDGARHKQWSLQGSRKDVRQTLADLKEMLLKSGLQEGSSATLTLTAKNTQDSFHSVVPYELVPFNKTSGTYFVRIYDPNHPKANDLFITVDSTANTYEYGADYRGKTVGLWLDDPISEYAYFTALPPVGVRTQGKQSGSELLEVYLGGAEDVEVIAGTGESMIFRDRSMTGAITDAMVLHKRTGYPSAPSSYILPVSPTYRIAATGWPSEVAEASVESPGEVLSYIRGGAQPGQSDHFAVGSGLRAINPEINQRRFALSGLRWTEGGERYFALGDLYLDGLDSTSVQFEDGDAIEVQNGAALQAYTLTLQSVVGEDIVDFKSYAVPMRPGATHLISPDWASLSDTVRVWVDDDGDGAYEDSLSVANSTVGVGRETRAETPYRFSLAQNYPNPFNPTTTISFALPQSADVTLAVHDVLGRQLSELATGRKRAGIYEVSFDAQHLPSGVYFYRIQAGDFVATRSMVLAR